MARIKVKVLNAEVVASGMRRFASDARVLSRGVLRRRGEAVISALRRYPPAYRGVPAHRWASERQRRYVLAALRAGTIKVPYQRTRAYAAAWHLEEEKQGFSLTTAGRSADRYARYVGGDAFGRGQAHIHAGRWPLVADVVRAKMARLPTEVLKNVRISGRRHGLSIH